MVSIQAIREQISLLLPTCQDKKKEWSQRTDFLFRKLDKLKKLEELTKLGKEYLTAHLLLKNAEYSAYHEGKLRQESFTIERYLARIQSEINQTTKRMQAADFKAEALDIFANQSIEITTQALAEKDLIIQNLQKKLAQKEASHD